MPTDPEELALCECVSVRDKFCPQRYLTDAGRPSTAPGNTSWRLENCKPACILAPVDAKSLCAVTN